MNPDAPITATRLSLILVLSRWRYLLDADLYISTPLHQLGRARDCQLTTPGSGSNQRSRKSALPAQVAELVDAQVSGTCGRKLVEVRVFSWAPLAGLSGSPRSPA